MPFLGKTPSQIVDPEVDIDGGTIDGVSIGSVTANAGAFTNLTATGTLTLPDDGISGDDVNGGTISNFASTGIDDNATSTALTVTDSGIAATLTTAAQPNITSVGTLSALSVTGDLTVDTDTLVVDATNNHVKIGDTAATPDGVLSIRSDSDAHAISIYEPAGANENWQIGVNASGDLQFYDSGQTVSKVTFQDGGDVGIGTTTTTGIQANLHIHSSSTDNGDGDGQVNFGDECSVIISTNAASAGGQGYYGSLFFGGQDITSATQQVWKLAGLSAYSSADLGTTASADLLFYTTSSSATPTERMRIASSGDVGIGTNDPDSKLDVRGTILGGAGSPSTGQIAFGVHYHGTTNIANTYGTMKSTAATCIGWGVYGSPTVNEGFVSSVDTSLNFRRGALLVDQNELRFLNAGQQTVARDAAVTMTERFTVNANGNVGIGNTNPTRSLDIGDGTQGANAEINSTSVPNFLFSRGGTEVGYIGTTLWNTGSGSDTEFSIRGKTAIGFTIGASEKMRLDASGNFLAGTTNSNIVAATSGNGFVWQNQSGYAVVGRNSTSANLYLNSTGQSTSNVTDYLGFRNSGTNVGKITYDGADVFIAQISDQRLKENIVEAEPALPLINAMQVRSFDWVGNIKKSKRFGFVAQELNEVFSDAVSEGGDDENENPWTVSEAKLIPVLTKAIQEQQAIIEDLQTRLSALEAN